MIETPRLILRRFHDEDREAFAALNGDARVGDWLGGTLDRAASDDLMDRIEAHFAHHDFGFWAAERKSDKALIGMIGLAVVTPDALPVGAAVEIGWRLIPDAWGGGYASEGAKAALEWGFDNLDVPEIIAFTASSNKRSQAVMRRIGMVADPSRDFEHPKLATDHPLRPHVVFAAKRP